MKFITALRHKSTQFTFFCYLVVKKSSLWYKYVNSTDTTFHHAAHNSFTVTNCRTAGCSYNLQEYRKKGLSRDDLLGVKIEQGRLKLVPSCFGLAFPTAWESNTVDKFRFSEERNSILTLSHILQELNPVIHSMLSILGYVIFSILW